MPRPIPLITVMLAALLTLAPPVAAGGWATVYLDAPPGDVSAGVPLHLSFMVMQHGVTPIDLDHVYLTARHRETAETIGADARQSGPTGHYLVDVTFPRAGEWKWEITPEPFAATSFETLTVRDEALSAASASPRDPAGDVGHPAAIRAGTCHQLGPILYPLRDVASSPIPGEGTPPAAMPGGPVPAVPVATGTTTVAETLTDLVATPRAITIDQGGQERDRPVACGDIAGQVENWEIVIGLGQQRDSGDVGVTILRGDGDRTTITLYMVIATGEGTPTATTTGSTAATAAIEIVPGGTTGWQFLPSQLKVKAGTTVIWTNQTGVPHTVTSDDLTFDDSGPLAPGQSFRQTFRTPGTYSYRCGPHPAMTGTIAVSEG
jgi:plastocyanin